MDNYIDPNLVEKTIDNKGKGLVARNKIPANTLIIKESPTIVLTDKIIVSDMFQLLYPILIDNEERDRFMKLCPHTLPDRIHEKNIVNELDKIKQYRSLRYIYKYFSCLDYDTLLIICYKYIRNAFTFPDTKPVILYNGAKLNHSCNPNVRFIHIDQSMHFITNRVIQPNEELTDNYIDTSLPYLERQQALSLRYGFTCEC